MLIDKDHKPVWSASLEDVRDETIDAFFAPLEATHPRGELVL